jgi:hypothetical protein
LIVAPGTVFTKLYFLRNLRIAPESNSLCIGKPFQLIVM